MLRQKVASRKKTGFRSGKETFHVVLEVMENGQNGQEVNHRSGFSDEMDFCCF